jgi:hypothetical protein
MGFLRLVKECYIRFPQRSQNLDFGDISEPHFLQKRT